MKLSLSLTDSRVKQETYNYSTPKTEDYTRVSIEGVAASAKVTAAVLRGIADEIDPQSAKPAFAQGGVIRA